ncbi:hypothetical protein AAHZ94_10660 [Streptomyces sp. HSW2009]|uniref:hypothetical protein n=1 Tax=Streptomyces sp. HSW2009 TaxID=3142890 RepID=UPI0032EE66F8
MVAETLTSGSMVVTVPMSQIRASARPRWDGSAGIVLPRSLIRRVSRRMSSSLATGLGKVG